MISKAQKIRLGVFISAAILILLATLFALSMNRLFQEKDIYYIAYKNVSLSGLDAGSSVKYLGLNVGNVKNIEIDPRDISKIIVTISIKKGTPVKKDVKAEISTIGITGIKVIELSGGTNESTLLKPGSYIQAGKSLTEEITGKAEIIGEKVELLLNNLISLTNRENRSKVLQVVNQISAISTKLDNLLRRNETRINSSLVNLDTSLHYLSAGSKSAFTSARSLENFINSDSLRRTLDDVAQIAEKLNKANIYNLDEQLNLAVAKLNHLLQNMDLFMAHNLNSFNQSIDQLNETIRHLNSAARQIDENPSVLIGGSKPDNPPDEKLEQ